MRFLVAAVLAVLLLPAAASAAPVPENAVWTQEYFTTKDGVRLHADVLRPKGLPEGAKTPVVLTVSPYTNHATQAIIAGGSSATNSYNPRDSGPSGRFYDLLEGAKLLDRGYSYVMVDLRGFGGSGGCNDWGGPGEQEDVRAAVRHFADKPWSTGKVALYGKSYDAFTGLMGLVQQPRGLAGVIAMEPVYDGYRYRFSHGVRFLTSVSNPVLFSAVDAVPGTVNDTPEYQYNSPPRPDCYAANIALQQIDDETDPYWRERELITRAKGATVPLFLTQGFLESNTQSQGAFTFFNNVSGPKRAWFGQFEHDRGNDMVGERLATGREGWFDEVNRFLDEHLKGEKPKERDPAVVVQSNDGRYRADDQWPPADATPITGDLNAGQYVDDGGGNGSGSAATAGLWTFSPPLPHRARLSGTPRVTLDAAPQVPSSNLVVDLYDVDPAGKATIVSRGATLVRRSGRIADLELLGQDWYFQEGHRIGIRITDANDEWYVHAPTRGKVVVTDASIALPFRRRANERTIQGETNPRLERWLATRTVQLPAALVADGERPGFPVPPAQR
jgi:uncharacterized protein